MTNLFLILILIGLFLIILELRILNRNYQTERKHNFSLGFLRNALYPIFSEQKMLDKKIKKEELFKKVKASQENFNQLEKRIKSLKKQSGQFNLSDSDLNQIKKLAALIYQKSKITEEYNNMVKLNTLVSNGQENFDQAWEKAYDLEVIAVDGFSNKEEYIQDFVARKKRLFNK